MKITSAVCEFEREPLIAPLGFKGGWLSELWQSVVGISGRGTRQRVGLGVQSVLWSDVEVFSAHSESVGNSTMFLLTAFAARRAMQMDWDTPINLLDEVLPATYEYGKTITDNARLRLTFALNALVPLDHAAWLLYCDENNITDFDAMIPENIRPALPVKHDQLACIPLMTYGLSTEEVVQAVEDGYRFLKIKVGADPDNDGDPDKMLEWDMHRLTEIHEVVGSRSAPYTDSGKIVYYLDANGRYDSMDRLMRLVDHAERIGALEQVLVFEEPFPEQCKTEVGQVPLCIAADESAHSEQDCMERIALGYRAIALKPIAKTMSMSLKIAQLAHQYDVPCFCADLTVNPVMVDWNKHVAARLQPLPGLKIGVIETNGHQNYRNWHTMKTYHPRFGAPWMEPVDGVFTLDDDFYQSSGGIFETPRHYQEMLPAMH